LLLLFPPFCSSVFDETGCCCCGGGCFCFDCIGTLVIVRVFRRGVPTVCEPCFGCIVLVGLALAGFDFASREYSA
jgi:hypothetical protein